MLIPARSRYQLINVHYNHPDMEIRAIRLSQAPYRVDAAPVSRLRLVAPSATLTTPPRPPLALLTSPDGDGERYGHPIQRPGGQASSLPFDQPTSAVNGAVLPSPCIPLCKYETGEKRSLRSGIETGSTNPGTITAACVTIDRRIESPVVSGDIIDAFIIL